MIFMSKKVKIDMFTALNNTSVFKPTAICIEQFS